MTLVLDAETFIAGVRNGSLRPDRVEIFLAVDRSPRYVWEQNEDTIEDLCGMLTLTGERGEAHAYIYTEFTRKIVDFYQDILSRIRGSQKEFFIPSTLLSNISDAQERSVIREMKLDYKVLISQNKE